MGRRYLYDKIRRQKKSQVNDPLTQVFVKNEVDEKTIIINSTSVKVQQLSSNIKSSFNINPSKPIDIARNLNTDHIYSKCNHSIKKSNNTNLEFLATSNQKKILQKAKNSNIEVHLINSENVNKTIKDNNLIKNENTKRLTGMETPIIIKEKNMSHPHCSKLVTEPKIFHLPGVIENLKYTPITPKLATTQPIVVYKPVSPVEFIDKRNPSVIKTLSISKGLPVTKQKSPDKPVIVKNCKPMKIQTNHMNVTLCNNIAKINQNNFMFKSIPGSSELNKSYDDKIRIGTKPNILVSIAKKRDIFIVNKRDVVNKRDYSRLKPSSATFNLNNTNTLSTSNIIVHPIKGNYTHHKRKQPHIVVRSSPITVTMKKRQVNKKMGMTFSGHIEMTEVIPTNSIKKEQVKQTYQVVLPDSITKEKVYPMISPDDIKKEKVEQIYPVALRSQNFDGVLSMDHKKLEETQILGI